MSKKPKPGGKHGLLGPAKAAVAKAAPPTAAHKPPAATRGTSASAHSNAAKAQGQHKKQQSAHARAHARSPQAHAQRQHANGAPSSSAPASGAVDKVTGKKRGTLFSAAPAARKHSAPRRPVHARASAQNGAQGRPAAPATGEVAQAGAAPADSKSGQAEAAGGGQGSQTAGTGYSKRYKAPQRRATNVEGNRNIVRCYRPHRARAGGSTLAVLLHLSLS
jgi:hypothetical protein